uniref:TSC22 domain family member 2 n=1 Tax=Oncorhynchus kisutch TaxID=8019 RepID=A0A8C7INW0_ONCKI
MSKMPAKKKSCFQITSVTQAQVAASSATDDTESLDDPDESRTEDGSSEIFDVSRADFEPEVCDRSSSEETLNHVGEQEAPGVMVPPRSVPKVGQMPAMSGPPNEVSVSTSQPVVTSLTPTSVMSSTASCSSRFRVIKLDHGTGEPFRKGRWTCTEFYEKDSEGNTVVNRTTDNIRHANAFDPSADRDSGLGLTGGTVVAPSTHSGQAWNSHTQHFPHQQPHGCPRSKSPSMTPAAQTQMLAYPPQQQAMLQQLPLGQHLPNQPPGLPQNQADYYQQNQPGMQAVASAGQTLYVGQTVGQGPSLVMTPMAAVGGGGSLPVSQPASGLMGGGLVGQYAPTGIRQPVGLHPSPPGTQNVPTIVPSASSATTLAPTAMPNLTASLLPGQQARDGRGAQGLPAAGFSHVEEGQPPAFSEKNLMKIPESLQLANNPSVNSLFGIAIDGDEDSASGASVVAIDNKIEQAMDLVKSHLMYAVREEVEVLKEQIKELFERNSMLEQENAVLKSLANSDQLSELSIRPAATNSSCSTPPQQGVGQGQPQLQAQPQTHPPLQAQQLQPQPQLDASQPLLQPQPNGNSA